MLQRKSRPKVGHEIHKIDPCITHCYFHRDRRRRRRLRYGHGYIVIMYIFNRSVGKNGYHFIFGFFRKGKTFVHRGKTFF